MTVGIEKFGVAAVTIVLLIIFGRVLFRKFNKLIDISQQERREIEKEFKTYLMENSSKQMKILQDNTEANKNFAIALDRHSTCLIENSRINQQLIKILRRERLNKKERN